MSPASTSAATACRTTHNYLELSDEKDARGLPKPRIHFTAGENEKRMTAHAEKLMRAIWAEAGAQGRLGVEPLRAHHRDVPHGDRPGDVGRRPRRAGA